MWNVMNHVVMQEIIQLIPIMDVLNAVNAIIDVVRIVGVQRIAQADTKQHLVMQMEITTVTNLLIAIQYQLIQGIIAANSAIGNVAKNALIKLQKRQELLRSE